MRPILLPIIVVLSVFGCSATDRRNQPETVIELVVISPDIAPFFMRQKVEITHDNDTHTLDAAIEYDGTTIRTVFLDPASRPAVVMEQTGPAFKAFGPRLDRVPFDPRWIMQIIGSALFISPLNHLEFKRENRDTNIGAVHDTAIDGRLTTRSVEKLKTEIEYSWDGHECPSKITIRNNEQRYSLNIVTLQCDGDVK